MKYPTIRTTMEVSVKTIEEQFDEVYNGITKLYDHAENMLKAAYHESVTDHDAFLAEIDPLVRQIEETANIIAEDFSEVIEKGGEPTAAVKRRVSTALRKVLLSIEQFKERIKLYESQEVL